MLETVISSPLHFIFRLPAGWKRHLAEIYTEYSLFPHMITSQHARLCNESLRLAHAIGALLRLSAAGGERKPLGANLSSLEAVTYRAQRTPACAPPNAASPAVRREALPIYSPRPPPPFTMVI